MIRCHQAGVFGGLPAQQRAPGEHATVGDPGDDLGDPFGHGASDGDVVLQKQRLGSTHHEVVDDHGDQVDADRVVLVHGLCDRQLGAHAVGRRGQERLPVVAAEREHAREAAQAAAHLGPGGLLG